MPWGVANYNTNPALNTTINGVDIAELCSAAGYNNALRQIMADIAAWTATGLATLGGLSNAYARLILTNKSGAFSPVDGETGYAYNFNGAAATMTLNPIATTPQTNGNTFVVRNVGSGALTIARGAGVLLLQNGATVSANATLAIGGVGTLIYWGGPDVWTLTGSGIS